MPGSPCLPWSPFVSLCLPLSPFVSLCLPLSPFVSLCLPVPPFVSLCLPSCGWAFFCLPSSPFVPRRLHCFFDLPLTVWGRGLRWCSCHNCCCFYCYCCRVSVGFRDLEFRGSGFREYSRVSRFRTSLRYSGYHVVILARRRSYYVGSHIRGPLLSPTSFGV